MKTHLRNQVTRAEYLCMSPCVVSGEEVFLPKLGINVTL